MDALKQIDSQNMRDMVTNFPQLLHPMDIGNPIEDAIKEFQTQGISGLAFVGMGGSAISGSYISSLLRDKVEIPITVVRTYTLPKYVTKNWVLIAISYSGNTEETLSSLKSALDEKIRTICITSDGMMKKNSRVQISLPEGIQPRAAFPLIFSTALTLAERLLFGKSTDFEVVSRKLQEKTSSWGSLLPEPKKLASLFVDKIPLYIGSGYLTPVAYRAKCQINENAKHPSFASELPEANHNEIEGFDSPLKQSILPIFLIGKNEHPRIKRRIETTFNIYEKMNVQSLKLQIDCESTIEEMLSMTHYLDMVSVELAEIKGVNPVSVDRITDLKQRLSR